MVLVGYFLSTIANICARFNFTYDSPSESTANGFQFSNSSNQNEIRRITEALYTVRASQVTDFLRRKIKSASPASFSASIIPMCATLDNTRTSVDLPRDAWR